MSAKSLKLVKSSLKFFYESIQDINLKKLVTPKAHTKFVREYPSREEIQQLIETAKSPRDKCIIKTLYSTALRNFEARFLRIEEFDFDN